MGQIDIAAKEYMKDPRRFADAFNGGLFKGKKVIDPDKLRELDPEEILLPDTGSDKAARKKERDLLKCASVMTDGITTCVILGIEDQTMIDYSMPVRTMLYDAMRYGNQVKALSKKNRKEKLLNSDDFTSGLKKEDRLLPVITLVFYLGSEEWDGAKSIHEMLVPCDESIKGRTADYKLNLIDPAKLNEEELNYYTTELKSVIKYVKCSKNLEELQTMLNNDKSYSSVDSDTAKMINALSGREIITEPEGGKNNMNNAIEELWTTAHAEGVKEGEKEERIKKEAGFRETARNMFNQGFRLDQALDIISYDENAIRGWWSEFENAPKLSV